MLLFQVQGKQLSTYPVWRVLGSRRFTSRVLSQNSGWEVGVDDTGASEVWILLGDMFS